MFKFYKLGISQLLTSSKGTMCLMILGSMTILAALNKIDGIAFSAACSVLGSIFCWSHSAVDRASLPFQNNNVVNNVVSVVGNSGGGPGSKIP